jgi:hypothetical protein
MVCGKDRGEKFVSQTSVFFRNHQILTTGIAGEHDFFFREKAFHPFVSHTDGSSLFGQHFISHSRIRILFLQQRRDAFRRSGLEDGPAGITANTYGDVGTEIGNDFVSRPHTFQ